MAPGIKLPDGTFEMRFPCSPDKPVPHLDVNADTGNFVYAVHQMPPGKAYMAGDYRSWTEFAQAWARVTGRTVAYREVPFDEMVAATPDRDTGVEVALMFAYTSDPGYDGGMDLLTAEDLRKVSPQATPNPRLAACIIVVVVRLSTRKALSDSWGTYRRASTAPC